jgi:hypothetical protein
MLKRLFSRAPKEQPLPPQRHPELGLLTWNQDADGWTGELVHSEARITLYIGGGSAGQYPPGELTALLIEPAQLMKERDLAARAALLKAEVAHAVPSDIIISALETYQHYLPDRAYVLVYESPSTADVLWRVNFVGSRIESCGCDD